MPYADNNVLRIHYHIEGDGPPVVLVHGLSGSIHGWYGTGYVDALKNSYKLILIDARGHGDSDKPYYREAYESKLRASDVTAVLDAENIDKAHYFGYSMGGSIAFDVAKYAPERFLSIIIGGQHPYKKESQERNGRIKALENGIEEYVANMEKSFHLPPERKAQMLKNDARALIAVNHAYLDQPDMSDVLPTITVPCLVFAGDADERHSGAEECAKQIPDARWVSLPGLDHGQANQRIDMALPHIESFLKHVTRG